MQKQSLTTSCQQINAQPDSEQQLLWRNSLPVYYKMCHYVVWNISFVSSGQLCQMCSLPPAYSQGWEEGGWEGADQEEQKPEKALMLYQHCSAIAKALLCYQGCLGHKCQTLHHTSCSEEH